MEVLRRLTSTRECLSQLLLATCLELSSAREARFCKKRRRHLPFLGTFLCEKLLRRLDAPAYRGKLMSTMACCDDNTKAASFLCVRETTKRVIKLSACFFGAWTAASRARSAEDSATASVRGPPSCRPLVAARPPSPDQRRRWHLHRALFTLHARSQRCDVGQHALNRRRHTAAPDSGNRRRRHGRSPATASEPSGARRRRVGCSIVRGSSRHEPRIRRRDFYHVRPAKQKTRDRRESGPPSKVCSSVVRGAAREGALVQNIVSANKSSIVAAAGARDA